MDRNKKHNGNEKKAKKQQVSAPSNQSVRQAESVIQPAAVNVAKKDKRH